MPSSYLLEQAPLDLRPVTPLDLLRLIGYDDVALYTGSWEEWSNHYETPQAIGSQP